MITYSLKTIPDTEVFVEKELTEKFPQSKVLKRNVGKIIFQTETYSLSTLRLMKKLEKKQPQGKIYLILDNASYHHSGIVKNYTKRKRRIKLIFLPPYSPNLNPIERLWRLMHQRLTWNRYFATYHDFRQQTLRFFSNVQNYRTELDSLITDNFQLLPVQQLQTWVCWV